MKPDQDISIVCLRYCLGFCLLLNTPITQKTQQLHLTQ
nr:MAG TPA: hypothetical protein [Caudoviricetes sp.]